MYLRSATGSQPERSAANTANAINRSNVPILCPLTRCRAAQRVLKCYSEVFLHFAVRSHGVVCYRDAHEISRHYLTCQMPGRAPGRPALTKQPCNRERGKKRHQITQC